MRVAIIEAASGAVTDAVLLEGFTLAEDGKAATSQVQHPEGAYTATFSAPDGCVAVQSDVAGPGWTWTADGGFVAPLVALPAMREALCADVDRQAEAQRLRHITGGDGQANVYLLKMTRAAQAQASAAATPPMAAAQAAAAYPLLAAEVGITLDPSTGEPAADVFGVARAVAAASARWEAAAAAIEAVRRKAKAAIAAAADAPAAQAARDALAWPV